MKNIKFLFYFIVICGFCSACFEDKGNYDYAGINKITVESGLGSTIIERSIGETVLIEPIVTSSQGEEGLKSLVYSWVLDGQEVSTEPVFEWVVEGTVSDSYGNLILSVTDTETGVVNRIDYTIRVLEVYEGSGLFVLSKNRETGAVEVHMLKRNDLTDENDETVVNYDSYLNIFSSANNGEALPASSFKMHEHYAREITETGSREITNQLTILSNNDLVSVAPGTFLKDAESSLSSMFDGNVPAGLQEGISDIYFGHYLDLIVDKQGYVYSRSKTTDEFFEFDKFLPEPLAYLNAETGEYEPLKSIKLIPGGLSTETCMLFDTDAKKLFIVWDFYADTSWGGDGYVIGRVDPITSEWNSSWPANVPVIENALSNYEWIYLAGYRDGHTDTDASYFALIRNPEDGKCYQYVFQLERGYSNTTMALKSVSYSEVSPTTVAMFTNPDNKIMTLKMQSVGWVDGNTQKISLTLIAEGNSLYAFNRDDPTSAPRLLYTADSPIVDMACMDSSLWPEYVGITYEDGSAEVISVKNAQYSTWNGRVWRSEGLDLGEVISVFYEAPVGWPWY